MKGKKRLRDGGIRFVLLIYQNCLLFQWNNLQLVIFFFTYNNTILYFLFLFFVITYVQENFKELVSFLDPF